MHDRLDKICFLTPPVDAPWTGPPPDAAGIEIGRPDGRRVTIDLPLFWFEPTWHLLTPRAADQIAVAVSTQGVLVSALHRDLAGPDEEAEFFSPLAEAEESKPPPDGSSQEPTRYRPRILPYRAERYGFQTRDLVGARVIDVRLSVNRDPLGHFGYAPERIERWEATPEDEPLAGGGWVPAASFPPDVASLAHLESKLEQLRQLSPTAAVFVSFGCHRLRDELPAILAARPDGLILRLDDIPLTGLQVAEVTVLARQIIDEVSSTETPLWIVPGPVTADDAAKLLALGASAIAIDTWCEEVLESASHAHQASHAQQAGRSATGYTSLGFDDSVIQNVLRQELVPRIQRVKGLCTSMQSIAADQRLACLSGTWAKALGIPALALPGVAEEP